MTMKRIHFNMSRSRPACHATRKAYAAAASGVESYGKSASPRVRDFRPNMPPVAPVDG
jgi:hypothetical protein